jgi:hypothetical protein
VDGVLVSGVGHGWRLVDLAGKTFGHWHVLDRSNRTDYVRWRCRCRCGRVLHVRAAHLMGGRSSNCGCARKPSTLRHGHAQAKKSRTYITWKSMRQRCLNAKSTSYERYGAVGITICDRWSLFENFLADMGDRPVGHSLDRVNPYGNYEPGNCRWATPHQQRVNRRAGA